MTKWKSIKCPNCSAPLEVEEDVRRAKCAYCGAISEVQPATGMFQVMQDVQVKQEIVFHTEDWEDQPSEPARQEGGAVKSVRRTIRLATLISLVVAGLGVFFALHQSGVLGGAGAGLFERMQWDGSRQPMVVDVTGDGQPEVLGLIRISQGESYAPHVAAFDLQAGRRLWAVELAPTLDDSHDIHLALAGGRLVAADPTGNLRGLDPATGREVFRLAAPERVEDLCAGDDGGLRVELKDKRVLALDAAQGEMRPVGRVERNTPCGGAWLSSPGDTPTTRLLCWPRVSLDDYFKGFPRRPGRGRFGVEGLVVEHVLEDLPSGIGYGLGSREEGTRVPGLVALELETGLVLWKVELPARDPLQVEERLSRAIGAGSGRVAATYGMKGAEKGWRVACFDAKDGSRVWDVPIPESETGSEPSAVVIAGDRLFVAHWTWLRVFDLASGELLTTLGKFI